jgi:ABC-2 type transport system ATP-binding protein
MLAIEIKDLEKTYSNGTQALKGINLEVEEGEFFALLGVNGAGKSTIINILNSLVIKTKGSVKIFSKDIDTNSSEAKNFIGVVPQEFNFNIFERVEDILIQQAGFYGIPKNEAKIRSEEILKKLNLWEKRNVISRTLSGGMKRRLMIARGLMHMPKLLILDEPTAGVDVDLRIGMWDYLKELNSNGTTILLTTHYLEEVEQLCDRAAIIKDGKIVKIGKVDELTNSLENQNFSIKLENSISLSSIHRISQEILKKTGIIRFVEHDEDGKENEKENIAKELIFTLKKSDKIGFLITKLEELEELKGNNIIDISPTGNRLEQLFLQTIK